MEEEAEEVGDVANKTYYKRVGVESISTHYP
jgi:hypothetical protein